MKVCNIKAICRGAQLLRLLLFVETFIHRLGRASGIDGLSAMKMVTQWQSDSPLLLVRPLLPFTRVSSTQRYLLIIVIVVYV